MAVTDITKQSKDGLGVSFETTFAEEVSGNAAPKCYLADPSTQLYVIPPSHSDVAALALESGGNLAAIKTNLTIQPAGISAASGLPVQGMTGGVPLPVNIVFTSTLVQATPVVTSNGSYSAGNEIGGLMTFAIGGNGGGCLDLVRVTSRSVLTTALKLYLFTSNPVNSTWSDKTTPSINSLDISSLLCVIPLPTADSALGTCTIWDALNIGAEFAGSMLYGVLVAVSAATLTSASASDITVALGVANN
jgi:hypothetical protein